MQRILAKTTKPNDGVKKEIGRGEIDMHMKKIKIKINRKKKQKKKKKDKPNTKPGAWERKKSSRRLRPEVMLPSLPLMLQQSDSEIRCTS